jgi:hypothetical protein
MKRAAETPIMRMPGDPPMQKDPSQPVAFGGAGPYVAPGVTDPRAKAYAQQAGMRQAKPARYSAPVAGGPGPSIPRLDANAEPGMSMADQAALQRAGAGGPPPGFQPPTGGMFQGSPPASMGTPQQRPQPQQGPAILPGDVLPEEATKDPAYRQGQGARYAQSQPDLAMKYGVLRGNRRIPPQLLGATPKVLKPETIEGLKAISEAQQVRAHAETGDAKIEQEAASGIAGAAGRLGNSPSDGPETKPALSKEEAVAIAKNMDDFDFNTFREMMMKDIINNEGQRKIIEARCSPIVIDDIVTMGFVKQRVPIVPGKFEPEFQSMRGDEDLAIKRLIMVENKGLEVTERYLLDKFALMGVTIGLYAVNGNVLPTHLDSTGKFNEELFWQKYDQVSRFPFHMLGSIGVNYYWFDIRVRTLFKADALGNG